MLDQNNRPMAWDVLSSETRVKDRFIHVRTDKCRAANGDIVDYHVLQCHNWVNIVPFEVDTLALLLVDEYRHGIGGPVLGLAGGAIDKEIDKDPREAARIASMRELREETGYSAATATLTLESMPNPALQDNHVFSFTSFDVVSDGKPSFDVGNGEFCVTVKRDFVDVLTQLSSGELIMQAMHVAALWSAARYILKSEDLPTSALPLRAKVRDFLLG